MRTATIQIRGDSEEVFAAGSERFKRAWTTGEYQGEYFVFSTPEQLFSIVTPNRWALVGKLQAIGPISLRGLARALGRDVKRVHEDAAALLDWGLIERDAGGKLICPYAVIETNFQLKAPATAA